MALLDVEQLNVDFRTSSGKFRAVDNVDIQVDEGEVLAIVGESGSGKSVSMLAIMGLLPWTADINAKKWNLVALTCRVQMRKYVGTLLVEISP